MDILESISLQKKKKKKKIGDEVEENIFLHDGLVQERYPKEVKVGVINLLGH